MDINSILLPFGWCNVRNELVDVLEVERGLACNCSCPSCRTPLVARRGDEREAHFAHATKQARDETTLSCDFSVHVAARLMARQLLAKGITLQLPACRDVVGAGEDLRWFCIAEACSVEVSDVRLDAHFAGVLIDLVGKDETGHRIVLYLTHPGRPIPPELSNPFERSARVFAIDLRGVDVVFQKARSTEVSCRQALQEALAGLELPKRWIFHPGHAEARKEALAELESHVAGWRADGSTSPRPSLAASVSRSWPPPAHLPAPSPRPLVNYRCAICNQTWSAPGVAGSIVDCVRCRNKLTAIGTG